MNENNRIVQGGKGILLCLLFYMAFVAIARESIHLLDLFGARWCIFSSVQRIVFGVFELWVFTRIYNKKSWRNVIHTGGLKISMKAGWLLFIDMSLRIVTIAFGVKSFAETTVLLVVSKLFFQQITTGFWEELTFRGFICEGYWQNGELTRKKRIIYTLISFAVFGMIHAYDALISGGSLWWAFVRFLQTGTTGMAFTAMYLYSGNLLGSMIMHFVFDIFANIPGLVAEWKDNAFFNFMNDIGLNAMYVPIAAVSIAYLLKESTHTGNDIVECDENRVSA